MDCSKLDDSTPQGRRLSSSEFTGVFYYIAYLIKNEKNSKAMVPGIWF